MAWPVMPLCEAQLKDVRPEDVLENGLYRLCDTYRGGGGYDQFNKIWKLRKGYKIGSKQFVVQVKGCPLKCPYCYVTREGIEGKSVSISTGELYHQYRKSGVDVFHLMGGAPAIYLDRWRNLAVSVRISGGVFHSDFLLVEHEYDVRHLLNLPGLHAVSIKEKSLYSEKQLTLMVRNLQLLIDTKVDFYLTFTGDTSEIEKIITDNFHPEVFRDSFHIKIIDYEALK